MNFDAIDFEKLFFEMFPHTFELENVKKLPDDVFYEELALPLENWRKQDYPAPAPSNIRFGMFEGDINGLIDAVNSVDEGWAKYFDAKNAYCAYDGLRVVSFALISDMGTHEGLKIGGPGCVGTIPEYRKQGIGLRLVGDITQILKQRGYDLSYIYYTGVGGWYRKLGYKPTLKWGRDGIVR